MSRRGAAWLLAIPLSLTGSECGHWLAYRIVYPDPVLRGQVLAASGHGYLGAAPAGAAAAAAAAVVIVALAVRVAASRRGGIEKLPSARPFLMVAPLAFALQECAEEVATGHLPTLALYTPTFLPGLMLALPFGLAAYAAARALAHGADRLTVTLGLRGGAARLRRGPASRRRPQVWTPPLRRGLLLGGLAERGPPLPAGCA